MLFQKNKEINKVVLLPLDKIIKNPHQPRRLFRREDIEELAASIRVNGLLQPITVRKVGEEYELVAGERRTMAFREMGETTIPAIVEDFSDQQSAMLALIENLQRKDLNCFEEAYGISHLIDQTGISQQEIAHRLGKAQSTIANKLRLLKFPLAVQKRLMSSSLTERHARALLRLEEEGQLLECIEYILRRDLNEQQTE
jgi:ParB family chromosome partitioning protein